MAEIVNGYSLSSAQRGIWFDQIRHADKPLYNIGGYVRIEGVVNHSRLEEAVNWVIQENDALCTVLHEGTALPVQVFEPAPHVQLAFHDFSEQPAPHQQAIKWMEGEIVTPFQLDGQLLFKFALIKVSEECYYWFGQYHHLIIDGWGISLLVQRVAKQYDALVAGEASEESARYSYRDFVQDDQNYLASEAYQRHERYWREKYRELPEPLIQRMYAGQFKGIAPSRRQTLTLKWEVYHRLTAFAKDNKATPFHLIIGVLYCYFIRTGGGKDFVIGLPVLNRNSAAFKRTVGLFTGVIPARFGFGTALNFVELMQAISTELRKDYRHQRFPLDEINKLAGLHKVCQQHMFDITLSYQKHDYLATFAGSPAKVFTLANGFEQTALAIAVEEYQDNQDVRLTFDYNLAAFDDAEIERIVARFEYLLGEVLARPAVPIRELSLMPEEERHQVLVDFNDTAAAYPFDKTIVDLFEEQVEKTPHTVAVVFEEQQLSYRELNSRANQLAHHLQTLGVKPEMLVGICVERSLDMIVGLLGILKAGGAYVPLDPSYPQERLAFMLADSQVLVLLTQQKLMTTLTLALSEKGEGEAQVVCLDTDRELFSKAPADNLVSGVQPDNLAYVIYTSGSTGQPKGVLVEHHGLCNLAKAQIQSFNVQPDSRVLQFASISFDASISEIVMALGSGATLCLGTAESLRPGSALIQQLREQTITHVTIPPTALAVLPTEELLDLQYIIVAGEACPPDLVAQWSQDRHFFNAYGPTEDTVCATIFEYTAGHSTLPIGRPLANTQIYILDKHLHPASIGVQGELYIGGVGLARGYLNRPDLTTEKFIPNPFSEEPGSRLYKTGDLARYLPDGNIEFLGRIDNQVKLRGFRIELGEIDAFLSQHPNVQETVVFVREDQPGDKRLVAYIVSDLIPERIPYQSECLVELDGKTLELRTEDISSHGVCLQQDESFTLKEGHEIRLRLQQPSESEEARWLNGKIVWSRNAWAGVQFTLTPVEQTLLDRSVDYLIEKQGLFKVVQRLLVGNLRHYLEKKLPNYMVPSNFVLLSALPLTPNGKVDRRALPAPEYSYSLKKEFLPQTEMENVIAAVWKEVLQRKKVGIYDHFFEIGGHSLLIAQVQSKLQDTLGIEITMVELFEYPTIHALAQHLGEKRSTPLSTQQSQPQTKNHRRSGEIAIIGMAGRFPGAKDIEAFWQNLRDGVESISGFDESEVMSSGIDTATLSQPNYVTAGAVLSDIELFDAAFFDVSPREAELMDPQHRLFLECAWEAIEHAGIESGTDEYAIGVYAGVGMNTYLLKNLYPNYEFSGSVGSYQLMIGNGNDFLPTRVSYKLNLKGPSVNIQTACSTSLVAVHSACKSLLDGECDIALAGGVSIRVPQKTGYLYEDGMIYSPDGHCRAFDAKAQGTVGGNGVGVVVLKILEDAIADGDNIVAIIKGSAINNDGSVKVGYTAPSVEGQAAVISEALDIADVEAETISYIETHGTGTKLGDPIEIAALTKAFQAHTEKQGFCAIGSVKTNIGHTDTAAGVAGLIKTVLALKHQQRPPSLHFEQPNPQINFANSPFYVNTKLSEWQKIEKTPRRAGVSSFGIGGTNAHVILEEAPNREASGKYRPWQLLVLSAKTDSALETATANLVAYLEQHPENNLADVAYTLSKGRKAFSHRRMLICQNTDDAVHALGTVDPKDVFTHFQALADRSVVFMFSGQCTQYVNMGLELYHTEPTFREEVDQCAEYLKPHLGFDLRQVLYPTEEQTSEATQQLKQTAVIQPALFVIDYALAKLWMAWGVHPQAMIGHSIGEYVAACLSGVFTLEEALALVAARGQLMQQLPGGAMLAVSLSESEVQPRLGKELSLAAINAPSLCVVSGVTDAVEALENQLTEQGVECRRLHTCRAFHSKMMEPILASFTDLVKQVRLCPPQIPYLSNVTGTWITAEEALTHSYWADHLRQTVRFTDGMQQLLNKQALILLEVGPGRTLSTLARRHSDTAAEHVVLSSLRHPQEQQSDVAFLLNTLGKLWLAGGQVDWSGFYANERRHRLPLPTYPFERQRYWVEPPKTDGLVPQVSPGKKQDIADWFYRPVWKESGPIALLDMINHASWLVFLDVCGLGSQFVKKLELASQEVITVTVGTAFTKNSDHDYTLNPQQRDDYDALLNELRTRNKTPQNIVHFWGVTPNGHQESAVEGIDKSQDLGFYSLLFLAQAIGTQNVTDHIQIAVVSNHIQAVTGEEELHPEKATVLGPVKVIGQEYPNLTCRSIDVVIPHSDTRIGPTVDRLLHELTTKSSDKVIAYRGKHRWVQTFEPVRLEHSDQAKPRLKVGGVYLITGGLGGMGMTLAEHLAKTVQPKLVLTGRSAFPVRDDWDDWLATHNKHDGISRKIRKVQALEEQGAEVLITSADVANWQQMQEVITATEQRFGSINGVIHAAGVPDGALIIRQTREMTETILAPKVKGTLVLESLLRNVELDFFILCSSLASILGIGGQIGYCAANAFLDIFAHFEMAKENRFTAAINWDAWQEVGMAAEVANQRGEFNHQSVGTLDISKAKAVSHPLFDHCIVDGSDHEIYVTHFSTLKHWVLGEHKSMGNGILPGTAYLEMAKAAFENHAKNGAVEIRQVYFLIPLMVEDNEEKEIRTILKKQGDSFEFSIVGQSSLGKDQWQEHARGEIACIKAELPEKHDLKEIEAKCQERKVILTEADYNSQAKQLIEFGPRWKNLKQIQFGKTQAVAILELSDLFAADIQSYQLHPALLDCATGLTNFDYFYSSWNKLQPAALAESATGFLSVKEEGAYYLPFSYKRLTIKGTLPGKIYSYVRYVEKGNSQKGTLKFNITIMDEQGTELVEIEDYTLRKVDVEKVTAKHPRAHNTPGMDTDGQNAPFLGKSVDDRDAAVTNVLQKELKEGLLPTEGVEVFSRILGSTLPQTIVSTRDLPSRLEQNNVATMLSSLKDTELEQLPKSTHPRPKLGNAYVAPRNELERNMTDIWQQFLGVEFVGIYDDFFELGGDSLLAISLIAKLRETFQTELSAQSLLNSPTIATLAEFIENTISTDGVSKQPVRQEFPFALVEFQKGNSLKTPLFLIHPVGGLIYFYRELAHYLGSDQPVYGLQAPSLDGKTEPLIHVEEMAALYIEVLRVRQPEGPYFLGGSSFGGMVAFEMAQQLRALGQEAALVAMMDTPGRYHMPVKIEDETEILAYFLNVGSNVSVSLDDIRKLEPEEQLRYFVEQRRKVYKKFPELDISQGSHVVTLFKMHSKAMWSYTPRVYPGKVLFFRAQERDAFNDEHPEQAWIDLAQGGLEILEVPGNHITMNFPPHVQVMAERLKPYLA